MNIIRVVIVEDDTVIRSSMQELLSFVEDLHCIGVYEKAEEFMRNFKDIKPDVVLMDITLPGMNGIQCVRETKPLRPVVQYLMCTSHSDAERTFDSLCAGATGYILKNSTPDQISTAIRDIHNGGSPMSAEIARLVVNSFPKKQLDSGLLETFTTREQEILHALAKGYAYKEIADKLFISIETVRTYLRKIYEKLQVHSKVEALNKVFPK
ncbi:MAG: response regulator transcription factor [Saprospiraceae bacterium]|nr:response regulator transcription factor [Saprospiraceae bacterium]MBK8484902.1 response regulator transcription factor [Saprospiraceae bacterium]MBK9223285.1 response regulator transcription factor [Saprospiraceae bacterium]MBK9720815.1 response regulator transcription factor [Saprospiraceae bacterium]